MILNEFKFVVAEDDTRFYSPRVFEQFVDYVSFFPSSDFNSIYVRELVDYFPRIRNVVGEIRSNPIQFLFYSLYRERKICLRLLLLILLLLRSIFEQHLPFLISKIKCSNLMYSADCRIFFYVSSWRQNTLDQEKCLEFFLFIMSKLQDSLRVEKILLVNILSTFRARKPKIFYVSTEETSTTLSTHTICYVSSTANTQCGRKKRRCVFCFIDPSFFKFIVSCSGLI